MLTYVRELWWQRVDYWHDLARRETTSGWGISATAAFEANENARVMLRQVPRIVPERVRIVIDRGWERMQMQCGIQFAVNDEALMDVDNRHVIEMAFGNQEGQGARLSLPDQIALLHSLLLDPRRPGTDDPAPHPPQINFVGLDELARDVIRFGSPDNMRNTALALMRAAADREALRTPERPRGIDIDPPLPSPQPLQS